MDKYLIPKIQAPAIKPIEFDIAPQLLSDVPIPSQINKKESQDDVVKRIKREILNSPKVDFGKIDNQFQDKYVQVTPDELSKVNKGDDITERIKFDENYEAVKSQTQGEWERAGNTAKKFGAAATSTFIGGLATIPNIIGSAINGIGYLAGNDKPVSDFFNMGWDSGINKTLSEFVDETNKNNRNYQSNWSKEHWIKDMIPIFGEGGFQEIIASSGYTAGAIAEFFLSGGVGSILSKGTKLAGMGGKISKYLNSPEKLDKMIDAFKVINKEDAVRKIIGEAGYMIGKGIEKSPQLYRAYVGAHVEAAFEGLEGAKRFEEEAIKQYKEKNLGMSPDQATLENIKKISQEVGDMRYKLNLAVLTVPNYLQMGALLKTFPGAEKVSKMLAGNKLLGELEAKDIKEGMFNVRKASDVKLNWNLDSKVGKYFEKGLEKTITGLQQYGKIPLSFSEGGEEYMQYIIDEYTSSLYKGAYLNPEKAKNVGEYLFQMFSTLSEKGTSKEAAQSFLMGSVGGGIQQTFNTGYELATNSNQLKSKIAANEKIAVELEELSKRMFSNSSLTDTLNDDDKEQLKDILAKSLNQNSITGTLEDKYNNALSALNSLSVMEDVLSSGNIDAQRWYYNIKDRHLSQILHEVVETGKQDVFKQHLNELAKADIGDISALYGINIKEQTRSHVDFVNDVLDKLNRIESNSKKLDFAFNEQFNNNFTDNKYRQYKGEMSHLKYMIDRQRERRDALKSTRTDVLNKILSGDYSQLESRIETLKLVQPDTQDYSEAKKELKRLEEAYKLFKNSTVFNTDGKLETIKTDKLAEALNKLDDVQDNTTKSVFEDLRKVNDIMLLDAYTSDNSPFVKEYKELYREDGFQKYLEKRKEYFEQLHKMFNKDRKEEDVKAKTEELLKDVPEEVKNVVKEEVNDVVTKDLTDEEIKDKVEEIVAENLPPQKFNEVIIDTSVQEKMTFDYPDVEEGRIGEVVTNEVIDNVADVIKQSDNNIEAKKADIRRKKQEELKQYPVVALLVKEKVVDGENKLLVGEDADYQNQRIERTIASGVKKGLIRTEIMMQLNANGHVFNFGNDTITINNFIQNRIDGKENRTFAEFKSNTQELINAKYDAELAALDQEEIKKENTTLDLNERIEKYYINFLIELAEEASAEKRKDALPFERERLENKVKSLKDNINNRNWKKVEKELTEIFATINQTLGLRNKQDNLDNEETMMLLGKMIFNTVSNEDLVKVIMDYKKFVIARSDTNFGFPRKKVAGIGEVIVNNSGEVSFILTEAKKRGFLTEDYYNNDRELRVLVKEDSSITSSKQEQEEIKKENMTAINDEEELQFDESNFFLNEGVPQRNVLTEKEKLEAESMMLQSGKLPEKKQDKVLFEIGKFNVYNNEKSISSINGKTLTGEQIDEFNKILNPLGWNIVDEEKKGTNSFKVRVSKTPPPTNIPSTVSISKTEDNIDFMQNDFYLNDSAFNKNKKMYNEALLERRKLLNSLKNINDLVWELGDKQIIDLEGKKIDSHTIANNNLLKIHQAPFFTISTEINGKKVVVQEYRDLRNGWGISKSFLSTLGIPIKDSFDFNSGGLAKATNFEDIKKDWVSLYNVVEYLENNNTEKFELLIEQLGLKENILRMSFRRQKLLESGKNNLRLKRVVEEYISSPKVHENSLHSNYIAKERIENLSNNVVIDKDGNQYTAILDIIIPYVQLIEGDGFTNEADKYRQILKDKIDEAKFKGTIENNIPLQLEIKAKLQAQLDETDSKENYINSPATFLNNGFNLIFTDSKGKPYVKNLIADVPVLPTSNKMLEDIKADVLVGDVRSNGWFINISGLQEQLGAKFEVVKVEFNKFATEKEDISGISILYLYQDEKGNDNFWRTNYKLSTANNVNTIPYLTRDIKNDIKNHFKEKVDISKISVNFVKSNKKKPENYNDIVVNNPYVIKGIEFENSKNKNDMRNKTTYSFFNDRVEVVEIEKQNNNEDEIVPVPTVTTKIEKEEKPSVKEQKKPIVKDDEQSELIKFFNQFKDVKIGDVKEELVVVLPEQYYILEEVISDNKELREMIEETINDEKISLQEKKEESILYLNNHIGIILGKIKKCNQ